MKAFSILFAILSALSLVGYLMGHENHLMTMGICMTVAFTAWPSEEEERSHE